MRRYLIDVKIRIFWLIKVAILVCAVAYSASAQGAPPRVAVQIDFFSGMTNPSWSFEAPEELAQLRDFVRGLPETTPPEVPQFGFRGFRLSADEARCRFPQSVTVFSGVITVQTSAGTVHNFEDVKGFEDFLRSEAEKRGFGGFLP